MGSCIAGAKGAAAEFVNHRHSQGRGGVCSRSSPGKELGAQGSRAKTKELRRYSRGKDLEQKGTIVYYYH